MRSRAPRAAAASPPATRLVSAVLWAVGLVVLLAWTVVMLYPLVWTVFGSFKDNRELYRNPLGVPGTLHALNYRRAWSEANIGSFYLNSLVVTAASLGVGVLLSILAAYVIARFRNAVTRVAFWVLTSSMMLPIVLTLVPKFLMLRALGMLDTRVGLILIYVAAGVPFGVFVMESFYRHLPRDFEDSASIDGASHFQTFFWIIVPISTSGMMVVSIFLFLRNWNEIYHAMILLSSPAKYTIPIGMLRIVEIQQYSIEWGVIFAGVVIVIIPVAAFFVVANRNIVRGLTSGALKG
jgi:N-acetylglucosamine transport system permease protein